GKENKDLDFCPVCNTSRWKDSNTPGKKVLKKVLRYFSIIPRPQRLYKSSHSAKEMIWHATGKCTEPGKMQHPIDGSVWKKFDTMYPDFAKEPRNVLLGLAADGFNPFGNLSQAYNMWPVILTTYNLPPPLIEDLKVLWDRKGVETIDVASGQKFNMRAIVLWTINDFSAQSSLSGWSGQGVHLNSMAKPINPPKEFGRDEILAQLDRLFDAQELKKVKWYVLHNSPEIDTYRSQFKSLFPNKDMKEEFPDWFRSQIHQHHVDNDKDPEVSTTSELFALACGPTWTPILVNSCVVDGVRYVVHSLDERRITQNNDICSPGPDGEMYYGQLQEILEFKYLLFKVVLFRVKWFDTRNQGRKVKRLVLRNNMTQIDCIDKAKPHWKVVEHFNHKKFSNGGVIVVEDDHDIIHFGNSSDLPLSTSLNDLDNATLHIDGQSTDVDTPPDIIDVPDEDDDIIDDEDAIPHDLADSDDEDLINVDDDGGYKVYSSKEED
nr:hypothetical protein [Tanacetum cinerariifolium]